MRIRGSSITPTSSRSSALCHSYSSVSSAPFPPCESNSSSSFADCKARCEGLDLLVEAVLHVTAPAICNISFAQRKVVRRAKRALRFERAAVGGLGEEEEDTEAKKGKEDREIEVISKPKRRKRVMALPSKYQDSVLQPWKRSTRQRRSPDTED
ncbi:hypothetical protein H6P81_005464 [Aristolochia fimbriata]|uniref:Uncharacterized protein n=1 Tax=Aristolochia fimbriata TaxID=158543 RepID=A0AAV7EWQ5_ARIFI|nr:hypothetical protein H6P81_005464 [Aristolochia fimbriata]